MIWQKDAAEQTPSYGASVAFFPDQNGDGIVDLLLGYTGSGCNSWSGMVYLLPGADGAELKSICGGDVDGGCDFGTAVSVLPDLDGDGIPEFIVGNSLYDNVATGSYTGAAFLYSGASWQLIRDFVGEDKENRFGSVVTTISDLDNDGLDDILIAAPRLSWAFPLAAGRVYIYSSASGNLLKKHTGEKDLDYFGGVVTRVRDLGGDGVDEYSITSVLTDTTDHREVELFDGAKGTVITSWSPAQRMGFGLTVDAGDLNGDGIGDLLITANGMASEAKEMSMSSPDFGKTVRLLVSSPGYVMLFQVDPNALLP